MTFYAPHSRHTEVLRSDIEACDKLRILADSPEAANHTSYLRKTDGRYSSWDIRSMTKVPWRENISET